MLVRLRVTDYPKMIPIHSMSPSDIHSEIPSHVPSNRPTSLAALHQVVIKNRDEAIFLEIGGNE